METKRAESYSLESAAARYVERIKSESYRTALVMAAYWHAGQIDKAGQPYLLHLQQVARNLLLRWPDASDEEMQAALLHDAVEDNSDCRTEISDEIGFHLGPRQLAIVLALTKQPGRPYLDWIRSIADGGDQSVIRVKLADIASNSDPCRYFAGQSDLVERKYEPARLILEGALK